MKSFLILPLIITLACFGVAFGQDPNPPDPSVPQTNGIDFSVNFVMGFPKNEFKTNYDKKLLPGLNLDLTVTPASKVPFWKLGAQLEALFGGQEKNDWNGLELSSSTNFISINVINRLLPQKPMAVKPFIELAIGLNLSYTSSTYEIYDKATFWEKFFLGEEDQVETITVKDHDDMDKNFTIGAGVIIQNMACLELKFNYIPEVVYVSPGGISVQDNQVIYDYSTSPVKLISLCLGITFNTRKTNSPLISE